MKRHFWLPLLLTVALAISACGSAAPADESTGGEAAAGASEAAGGDDDAIDAEFVVKDN